MKVRPTELPTRTLSQAAPMPRDKAAGGSSTLTNLANLETLEFSFPSTDGRPLTGWAIYAEPIDPKEPLGPVRQVGDDDEGFSCIDDVARIAQIYLTDFERTGSQASALKAREAVEFCLNLENGEGLFYNFVEKDGQVNKTGHTSFLGFTWWTARAFGALAQAERVLDSDPEFQARVSASLDRTVAQMKESRSKAEVHPNLVATYQRLGIEPGTLLDDSGSITALFALGLAQRVRSGHADETQRALLGDYAEAIMKGRHDAEHPFLGNLHINSLNDPQTVHLYGNNQVQALCEAGTALGRPEFIASARLEADSAYPRLIAAWMMPFAVSPSPEPFPQIAYSAECAVSNLQALYKATGEKKFSLLAGLFGSWFTGANVAGQPVYHSATGRAFDGVDPQGVSINSGAESNAEALLAMQALEATPGEALLSDKTVSLSPSLALSSGKDFLPGEGASLETRSLNGGALREIWKLEPGGSLSLPKTEESSWVTWHGPPQAELAYQTEAQLGKVAFDGSTHFDVDQLPSGVKRLHNASPSPVWIESLTQQPAGLIREWETLAGSTARLTVSGLDTAAAHDDRWSIDLVSKATANT